MICPPLVHVSPSLALQVSKKAQRILLDTKTTIWKSLSLWQTEESPELWLTYENLVHSCLRAGDENSAYSCLQRLIERFGADNERVMAITGLYKEAVAKDETELKKTLEEYKLIIQKDPSNMPVSKRHIALLTSLGRPDEAIIALNKLLDISPNDSEAWAELSDLYVTQGMYEQAIFALEELLLVTPYAWNIHARLGELLYILSHSRSDSGNDELIVRSLQCFCRSIELCDDYFRGYYGLELVTNKLQTIQTSKKMSPDAQTLCEKEKLARLHKLAITKLSEISE